MHDDHFAKAGSGQADGKVVEQEGGRVSFVYLFAC